MAISYFPATGGGSVADGDKGDITVSASGATWTIDNNAVTTAKIADNNVTLAKIENISTSHFLGRHTAGSGAVQQLTATQARSILNVEDGADVTDAVNIASSINGASAKTTPIDADSMPLIDSADSSALKKVTWTNIKATLKTYFDTLYQVESLGTETASTVSDDAITYAVGKTWLVTGDADIDFDTKVDETTITSGGELKIAFLASGANRSVDFTTNYTNNLSNSVTVPSGRTAHFILKNLNGTYHCLLNDIS